jgi:hypothetical protein
LGPQNGRAELDLDIYGPQVGVAWHLKLELELELDAGMQMSSEVDFWPPPTRKGGGKVPSFVD